MKVFILHKGDKPYSHAATIAVEGFFQRGAEIVPFQKGELTTREWTPEEPVIAGIGALQIIFQTLGIAWKPVTYPLALRHFLGRETKTMRLGDLRRTHLPAFVKPEEDNKRFTGFVLHDIHDFRLGSLDPTLPIYVCEPVEFLTEYRVYVLNGKILNVARYRGPVDLFPNMQKVRGMILSYTEAPIAYSLDVGVTNKGETLLVETNEPLSLGNYGLPPTLAAKMIHARWNEIVGLPYHEEADCPDSPAFLSNP